MLALNSPLPHREERQRVSPSQGRCCCHFIISNNYFPQKYLQESPSKLRWGLGFLSRKNIFLPKCPYCEWLERKETAVLGAPCQAEAFPEATPEAAGRPARVLGGPIRREEAHARLPHPFAFAELAGQRPLRDPSSGWGVAGVAGFHSDHLQKPDTLLP